MKSISWMTFIFVVAFAMYLRSYESFSSANRDEISMLQGKSVAVERSLSSVDEKSVKEWKRLKNAIDPQPSSIHDFQ